MSCLTRISKIFASQAGKYNQDNQILNSLLIRRSRIVGAAVNKLAALKLLLANRGPSQHTLFFCGDGTTEIEEESNESGSTDIHITRQIELISELLDNLSWNVSHFTSRESRKQREKILENFRLGLIDALVAIRCLDEGIDIPACSEAYILASSRDPRQFIQRRGRILRKSPGKELATIHDFVVILPEDFPCSSMHAERHIRAELQRVSEFASLAVNRTNSYRVLAPMLRTYDLEHLI